MDVRKLNRGLIELAVSQGIREIRQDTKRGLRRLSDLGQYFASRRFSENIFLQIHEVLKQEDSRYYHLIQNVLDYVEEDTIKCFGINLGYNSWTYGVSVIRQRFQEQKLQGKKNAKPVSWLCELPYNSEKGDPSERINHLSSLINRKQQEGVYTYALYPQQTFAQNPELVFLLDRHPDCDFLWFFRESDLTEAQLKVLKKHNNCIYLFPAIKEDGTADVEIAGKMKENRILYSYYYIYEEAEGGLEKVLEEIQPVLQEDPSILIMKAGPGVSEEYRAGFAREIWNDRMHPGHNTFLAELTEDSRRIDEMIAGERVQRDEIRGDSE
ncbi:MAG: hypothetical protein SOW08_10665 [Lachnospiraceae bacterium]|nr:hypothetical protein [Lachnospiraceae bacterium]